MWYLQYITEVTLLKELDQPLANQLDAIPDYIDMLLETFIADISDFSQSFSIGRFRLILRLYKGLWFQSQIILVPFEIRLFIVVQ